MLSLHIIAVGKDKDRLIGEQTAHFKKLIAKYARLTIFTVPEEKYGKSTDIKKALATEATKITAKLNGGYLIVLDVLGINISTEDFAEKMRQLPVQGQSSIEFIIGGPYGIDAEFKQKADMLLSLSRMTMSHQLVRLVLLEQLYRSLNLNAGGSYHK